MLEKEIERAGIPCVQVCTIVPIAEAVGANRIMKAVAIPYPLGNPNVSKDEEKVLQRTIIEQALDKLCEEN